jgi:hypothetical protein
VGEDQRGARQLGPLAARRASLELANVGNAVCNGPLHEPGSSRTLDIARLGAWNHNPRVGGSSPSTGITSSGITLFAGIPFVDGGFRGFGKAAGDRHEPPETAGWLTKQSNEPSNIDPEPFGNRRAQNAVLPSERNDAASYDRSGKSTSPFP